MLRSIHLSGQSFVLEVEGRVIIGIKRLELSRHFVIPDHLHRVLVDASLGNWFCTTLAHTHACVFQDGFPRCDHLEVFVVV